MTTTPRPRPRWAFLVIGRVVVVSLLATAMVLGPSLGLGTARADAGGTQRGFALIWGPYYDGPQMAQSLREMVEVGATWVQFTPTWGQEARNASEIARTPRTVSDDSLERAIALAHEYGLKVFLTPHLIAAGRTVAAPSAPTIARPGSPRTRRLSATTRRWRSGWGSSSSPSPASYPRSATIGPPGYR